MNTTKRSGNAIPDGTYFVEPDGYAWAAVRFDGGKIVARTAECNASTHDAANDEWAGVRPSDDDELLDLTDEQLSIDIALAFGHADAYGVAVSRPHTH